MARAALATSSAPQTDSGQEAVYQPCQGMNCGATDGKSHSPECFAEHAAMIDPGVGDRHPEYRYAGYRGESFPATATEDQRAAWVIGVKARLPAQAPAETVAQGLIDEQLAQFRAAQVEAGIPDEDLMPADPPAAVAWLINAMPEWR